MVRFSAILGSSACLWSASAQESECSGHNSCGGCTSHTKLGMHACHWCELDVQCHDMGSQESPCAPSIESKHCVSGSSASSCKTECSAGDAVNPRHVHLSLAGASGMRVAWKTNGQPHSCSVELSTGTSVLAESQVQYLDGHGYHHMATLQDLTPGTDYQYHVDCDGQTSAVRSFHVALEDLAASAFLVIGDMGTGQNGQALASRKRLEALKSSVDLSVHVGDIGYADDTFLPHKLYPDCVTEFCYEAVYDEYMDWMESHMDTKPYMVAVGNHESECHSPNCLANGNHKEALRNFTAYNARWSMPARESGGVLNMWYSFDYGPVHFVAINTETDFSGAAEEQYGDGGSWIGLKAGGFAPEGEYLRWLEADLAAANANRAQRPWIVALGHRTWIYQDNKEAEPALAQTHKPLFEKYGVDLFLAGHWHAYSRHLPTDNIATPVVVTGGAGSDEGLEGWEEVSGTQDGWEYYANGKVYQIGTLETSHSELTWKAFNSETGEMFDTFTLKPQQRVIV